MRERWFFNLKFAGLRASGRSGEHTVTTPRSKKSPEEKTIAGLPARTNKAPTRRVAGTQDDNPA